MIRFSLGILFEVLRQMWSNYIILIIRKPKSWGGLTLINLSGLVIVYALIIYLINRFLLNPNLIIAIMIGSIMLVAIMAYVNYIVLQLKKRVKEIYIRKLFGAERSQILSQLLLESIVLTSFLVVSGMVLLELVLPFFSGYNGERISLIGLPLIIQVIEITVLVLPIGILAAIIPINNFINYINKNFSRLSKPTSVN